jgi:hypothetical protein
MHLISLSTFCSKYCFVSINIWRVTLKILLKTRVNLYVKFMILFLILTRIEIWQHILAQLLSINFREAPQSGSRCGKCGETYMANLTGIFLQPLVLNASNIRAKL